MIHSPKDIHKLITTHRLTHIKKINTKCLKSRTGCVLKTAYQKTHKLHKSRGLKTQIHFLDNECAESFKHFIIGNLEEFKLVTPHIHRRNAADRAIQTSKSHFIAGLASVNTNLSLHMWCFMVPYAVLNTIEVSEVQL